MGAVIIKKEFSDQFVEISEEAEEFPHGFTAGGHPVGCAIALKAIDVIINEGLLDNVRSVSPYFHERLNEFNDYEHIGETRGIGLMAALEMVKNKKTKEPLRDKKVIDRIAEIYEKEGSDCWFTDEPKKFLGKDKVQEVEVDKMILGEPDSSGRKKPIVQSGSLEIQLNDGSKKVVGITRAHLEEDAGKSVHDKFANETAIDLNRAGTPLLEIVSEPDIRSAEEATAYMQKVHQLVRYLKISDGNMQEGSFRCDANISVRPIGQKEFGTRAEIKNINSFRFVENAINYEVERQIERLENGDEIVQETRLYDPDRDEKRPMRSKEEANDCLLYTSPSPRD